MSYNKYYSPTTWEDFPSENTAINAQRLNHLEDGVDELDDRICALDVNKSQVSWNQQLLTGDKIAEISINGVVKNVYAPNVDDASQQAQAAALVSEGHAQGTQGGSAVGPGSQYYHNNAKYYAEQASTSFNNKIASEGYALGTENGDPVTSGSIYYHNNAKYYAEQARSFTPEGYQELVDEVEEKIDKSDVDVKSVTTGKFDTITGGLMQSCVVDLEPIQSGSGTPSPSNVRAISGHTQVQVGNCGKNKLPLTLDGLKAINTSGSWSGNTYTINGITFTINTDTNDNIESIIVNGTKSTSSGVSLILINTNNVPSNIKGQNIILSGCPSGLDNTNIMLNSWGTASPVYDTGNGVQTTFPASPTGIRSEIQIFTSNNFSNVVFKPMIRKATDSADFEPYNGYITTINLGGTYYGGTLDAVSGVLTVTHGFKTFDGSEDEAWNLYEFSTGLYRAYIAISDIKQTSTDSDVANIVCNRFPTDSYSNSTLSSNYITGRAIASQINVFETTQSTLANWKTYLASNNLQIAYELATPQTIQLDPQTLETLVGKNDVFAPLQGQSLDSLSYREVMAWDDVEKAVNVKLDLSSVAPIEYTDKASQSYNQKQLFIKDNKLCQALASISSGASFTENTNFKYTTLAEIIEPLIP